MHFRESHCRSFLHSVTALHGSLKKTGMEDDHSGGDQSLIALATKLAQVVDCDVPQLSVLMDENAFFRELLIVSYPGPV